jgi:hypothetical protein
MIRTPCFNRLYTIMLQTKFTRILQTEVSYIHCDFLDVSANLVAIFREVKYIFFHFLAFSHCTECLILGHRKPSLFHYNMNKVSSSCKTNTVKILHVYMF